MSSIESAIAEAVTTDKPQVILSAGEALDAFDECLEHILQQQMRLNAEGITRSWPHTQLKVPIHMPKTRTPIESLYQQIVRKAGPETLVGFFPDLVLKQHHRDSTDPVVQALVLLSSAVQKRDAALQKALFTYLLKPCSQEALGEMGLSENLEHLDDKLFVLSMVLRCLIGVKAKVGTGGAVGPACRIYLLLDEIENLLTLPGEIAWAFLHALESLSHDVGDGLTLSLHIKTTEATTTQGVKKRLGSRLLREWVTHSYLEY
jgi:hypothetical protein